MIYLDPIFSPVFPDREPAKYELSRLVLPDAVPSSSEKRDCILAFLPFLAASAQSLQLLPFAALCILIPLSQLIPGKPHLEPANRRHRHNPMQI